MTARARGGAVDARVAAASAPANAMRLLVCKERGKRRVSLEVRGTSARSTVVKLSHENSGGYWLGRRTDTSFEAAD